MPQNITFKGRTSEQKRRRDFINKNMSYLFSNPTQGTGKSNRVMYQPAPLLLPNENDLQSSTAHGQPYSPIAQSWGKEASSLHLYWNVTGYWLNELGVLRRDKITKEFNLGNQYEYIIHVTSSWRFGVFWMSNFSIMTHGTLVLSCMWIPSQGNIFKARYIMPLYQFPQHTRFLLTRPPGSNKPSPRK